MSDFEPTTSSATLLVTGAGGQLGRALQSLRPDGVFLSKSDLDVTDDDAVIATVERHRPGVIVHAAAWTSVDQAETHPLEARRVNVAGTRSVLRAAADVDALMVYPSTDYVFSGTARRPYVEDDTPEPLSMYGRTKLEGEQSVAEYDRHVIVRSSWIFGDGDNFVRTILDAARTKPELEVVADQIGLPTYAVDLAKGILDLVDLGATGTFHLAGQGDPCSWAELAETAISAALVAALLEQRPAVRAIRTEQYRATRTDEVAPRPAFSALDCTKAAKLGVSLRRWREAVAEYVRSLPETENEPTPAPVEA
ncbi:MAG TPA: dTDP-4-dehydrorhamnose reductase [Actinomycetota bacterium]